MGSRNNFSVGGEVLVNTSSKSKSSNSKRALIALGLASVLGSSAFADIRLLEDNLDFTREYFENASGSGNSLSGNNFVLKGRYVYAGLFFRQTSIDLTANQNTLVTIGQNSEQLKHITLVNSSSGFRSNSIYFNNSALHVREIEIRGDNYSANARLSFVGNYNGSDGHSDVRGRALVGDIKINGLINSRTTDVNVNFINGAKMKGSIYFNDSNTFHGNQKQAEITFGGIASRVGTPETLLEGNIIVTSDRTNGNGVKVIFDRGSMVGDIRTHFNDYGRERYYGKADVEFKNGGGLKGNIYNGYGSNMKVTFDNGFMQGSVKTISGGKNEITINNSGGNNKSTIDLLSSGSNSKNTIRLNTNGNGGSVGSDILDATIANANNGTTDIFVNGGLSVSLRENSDNQKTTMKVKGNAQTIEWGGRVTGSMVANSGNTTNKFSEGVIFSGHLSGNALKVTMEKNSKLILTGNRPSYDRVTDFRFQNLTINGEAIKEEIGELSKKTSEQNNTIIDLVTDGKDLSDLVGRDYFKTITIGGNGGDGLKGNNGLFRLYLDLGKYKVGQGMYGVYSASDQDYHGVADVIKVEKATKNVENGESKAGTHYIQVQPGQNKLDELRGNPDLSFRNIVVAMVRENDVGETVKFKSAPTVAGASLIKIELKTDRVEVDIDNNVCNFTRCEGRENYTRYKLGKATIEENKDSTKVMASTSSVSLSALTANMNSLNKRMGELRDNANSHGVWARVFNGKETSNATVLEVTSNYTTFQAGYDYSLGNIGANNYLGFTVAYGMLDSKSAQSKGAGLKEFSSKSNHIELGVYNAYVTDSGIYTDTIAKLVNTSSDITYDTNTKTNGASSYGVSISQEVGYRAKISDFYIDPQVEVILGYLGGTSTSSVISGVNVKSTNDSILALRTRVGAVAGYSLKTKGGLEAGFRVGGSYVNDYTNGGGTTINDGFGTYHSANLSNDNKFVLNLGTNIKASDNVRVHLDLEKSFFGKTNTDYLVNVGVRYSFGSSAKNGSAKSESDKSETKLEEVKDSEQ